ncbi:MAG: MraY family glycosyltransferase [Spirochaetales bacterium]
MRVFVTILLAFALNLLFTPVLIRYSKKKGWYDRLDDRKIHNENIPRTGGIGIFFSFLLSIMGTALWSGHQEEIKLIFQPAFLAAGAGSLVMFVTGILDDFLNLRARFKLFLQIAAALIALAGGLSFGPLLTPFGNTIDVPVLSFLLTLVWIVGVTNAVNLIDGMDGMAGGIAAIAAIFWILIAFVSPQIIAVYVLLPAALLGAVLGFLVFNKPRAHIFMGDTGSLVLGYLLSLFPLFRVEGGSSIRWLLVGTTLLIIPIFDTLSAILRRLREKRSIGNPDREHIHHKFLDMGWKVPQILGLVYSVSLFSSIAAYLWIRYSTFLPAYTLPLTWIPAASIFVILHYKRHAYRNNNKKQGI